MSEEILINITPRETRMAVVDNGVLQEVYLERVSRRGLVGNIYLGKVVRVLPGMQAAFVEIGLERAAFLHISDMVFLNQDDLELELSTPDCITKILSEGQQLAVQVTKEPLGSKGARLTTRLALPSRYLVFMPELTHIGVSQRIEDEEERKRLKDIVAAGLVEGQGSYIIRTAAEGATQEELINNREFLQKYWHTIKKQIETAKPGDLIYEDLPLYLRTLRDFVSPETERVRIDAEMYAEKAMAFVDKFNTSLRSKIEYYSQERPIFDLYGIEDELQKALSRKVLLKSGGYLIFDQTEAMTTIDVNTGAFVGNKNLEETIFKTNLEAASGIARQIRLRNIGGIIIIDFIDMKDEDHKRNVLRVLEKALARDHTKNKINGFSTLGLVEMTRKRTRDSLEHLLCEVCPVCEGRGNIKTAETVCIDIFREVLRAHRAYDAKSYLVLASQEVVDRMLDEESTSVAELEDVIGKPLKLQVETLYNQAQFDVVLM